MVGSQSTRTARVVVATTTTTNVLSCRTVMEWMGQISRCQAFLLLSCAVILVESFICNPSHHHHHHVLGGGGVSRPPRCLFFHRGELTSQDRSWNSTATAMNEACSWMMASPTMEATRTTESVLEGDTTSSSPPRFEYRVSDDMVDYWFHVLGGMEDEDVVGGRPTWKRGIFNKLKGNDDAPSAAPTTTKEGHRPKPTDHWML